PSPLRGGVGGGGSAIPSLVAPTEISSRYPHPGAAQPSLRRLPKLACVRRPSPQGGGKRPSFAACAHSISTTYTESAHRMTTYDAIILGAGHNGLILQAYLGKAGIKTLAVERRAAAGGGLSTIEDARGFLHNTHAFFLRAVTTMPWYADLELERHGARLIEPELNVALITRDGRTLEWQT